MTQLFSKLPCMTMIEEISASILSSYVDYRKSSSILFLHEFVAIL